MCHGVCRLLSPSVESMRGTLHARGSAPLPGFLQGCQENTKVVETLVSGLRCRDGKEGDNSPLACSPGLWGWGQAGGQQVGSSAIPPPPPGPAQSPPTPFNI